MEEYVKFKSDSSSHEILKLDLSRLLTDEKIKTIKNLNGKYIKLLLSRLEHRFDLPKDMRKVILDTLNDYARELHEEMGI